MALKLIIEIVGCVLVLGLIVWSPVAITYWSLYRSRGNLAPARALSNGGVEFAPRRLSIWTSILLESWILYGGIVYLWRHHERSWNLLIILGVLLAEFLSLIDRPGTIVVGSEGLEQVYWLQENKLIRWGEIVEVNTGDKIRTVTITGADGTKIVHSKQLADRPRLLQELKRHCGDDLPPDFPRETTNEA